ncbi:MAG: hypothetical protein HYZ74_09595 [Elusimicrobia bacterium]|nr:hypothetical protein [Elusimicrobiota bacterium]
MSHPRVALVTCDCLRELVEDDRPLLGELWRLGVKAEAAVWDDPAVDWRTYDAALIRSAWDYYLKPAAFLAWVSRIEALGVALWNPASVVRANADKRYLDDLRVAGVSVIPTQRLARGSRERLADVLAARGWSEAVVKPAVSAGAYRTIRVRGDDARSQAALEDVLASSDALIQPYVKEIETAGEWSFVFIAGEFSHSILKTPGAGDFRVQEGHGGRASSRVPPAGLLDQAREAAAAGPGPWLYARVDGVDQAGRLMVMELELIEPALYLSYAPGAAARLAAALTARLPAPRPLPSPSRTNADRA